VWGDKLQTWLRSLCEVFVLAGSTIANELAQKSVDGVVAVLECGLVDHEPHFDWQIEKTKDLARWGSDLWLQTRLQVAMLFIPERNKKGRLDR